MPSHGFICCPLIVAFFGTLLCFLGWFVYRLSINLIGFLVGSAVGYILAGWIVQIKGPNGWDPWTFVICSLLFGVTGMVIIRLAFKTVLFFAGIACGAFIVSSLTGVRLLGIEEIPATMEPLPLYFYALIGTAGLLCGLLFVVFEKLFVILYTASMGAYIVVALFSGSPLLFLFLLVAGALVQFRLARGTRVKDLKIVRMNP